MSLIERFKLVRQKGLVTIALHEDIEQETKGFCKVQDCKEKHSTFLHENTINKNSSSKEKSYNGKALHSQAQGEAKEENAKEEEAETKVVIGYVKSTEGSTETSSNGPAIGLSIVPVKVRAVGSDKTIETYAFLDTGSNTSFCSQKLMKQLNIKGKKTTLSLTTMEKAQSKTESSIVSLELSDLNGENLVRIGTVFSTPELPVTTRNLATKEDMNRWIHLADIEVHRIEADVGLLIGCDVPEVLEPIEIRRSQNGGPYATRAIFGWVINGPLGRNGTSESTTNFVQAVNVSLEKQFESFCNREFMDTEYSSRPSFSREDNRALEIMSNSVRLNDGHYEIALPWKKVPPELPNNRTMAERRLNFLKKRLEGDPSLMKNYSSFIEDLLKNGYARKVPDEQLTTDRHVWYLPHHPVFHPQKPDKTRVVFDCSAKFQGTSLNNELLQGPDLTNSLIGVLTRFRQGSVAFMADIEAMFHQVRVPLKECDVLRFLWWPNGDTTANPEEFQMMVHLFGGISSPSCANYALKRTAEDNKEGFHTETTNTLERNFYVDDCLKSVETEEKAIHLAKDLRQLLQKGGFRLTKWMSNSRKVLESLPESERATTVKNLDFGNLHIERALGVRWEVISDRFCYLLTIKDRPATRRGILSIVSSIYDPLGFVSPFILLVKILLQDLCRRNLGWDEQIPEDALQRWKNWLSTLPRLEETVIDRCFVPAEFGEIASRELHHFSDASQVAYGAVSYLRTVSKEGDIHCSFLIGKSRLAPLKATTIPRLELSAAVVATRLDKVMQQELEMKIERSAY